MAKWQFGYRKYTSKPALGLICDTAIEIVYDSEKEQLAGYVIYLVIT